MIRGTTLLPTARRLSSRSFRPVEIPGRPAPVLATAASVCSARSSSSATPGDAPSLPSSARCVVVGGGIIGASVAYHLSLLPAFDGRPGREVILLERDRLTSGTTWHAAGLVVTFGSLSETSTAMRRYTKDLYARVLEEETGQSTGFRPVGFVELATGPDRLEEFRRTAAFNRRCGVDVREISAGEVRERFPLCRTDDVLAGFYVADDGRVNPVDATAAFAKGAKSRGVQIYEGVSAKDVLRKDGRVAGVETDQGTVSCDYVVNAAGMWARQFGARAGVCVPNQAAEHYYLVTDAIEGVDPDGPVVEDPASCAYIRPEGDGLLIGLFEKEAAAWNPGAIPEHFSFGEIPPDWERTGPYLEQAMRRVPASLEAGAKQYFCGPESFTPDLGPIVGEAPELRNYFVAAGLNSIGILTAGGVGKILAHWMAEGSPDVDVTGIAPDRFRPHQATEAYRAARATEALGTLYRTHYPHRAFRTARDVKRTPLHERLRARGAHFRPVSDWECADWYGDDVDPDPGPLSFGRPDWFPFWEREHRACREGVVLMDMSFMSKFSVEGDDAGAVLERLSTARVDGEPGRVTYCQWLDEDGRVAADVTVAKLDHHKFMVVATDTAHRKVETWMRRGAEDMGRRAFFVADRTGAYAQINIQGPRSRDLLAAVTSCPVDDASFPFRAVRRIEIGYAVVTAARLTYLGELGYELYVPAEQAVHVYDLLVREGEGRHGLVHAGLKALSSLRLEKGYRDYGHDVDNADALESTGLAFTCDFEKAGGFVGKEAVLARKARAKIPSARLVQVLLDDPEPMLFHGEVLRRDDVVVGDVRAGSFGHTLGAAVGLGMVESAEGASVSRKYLQEGRWDVEIAERRWPCKVSLGPLYDPTHARIKG